MSNVYNNLYNQTLHTKDKKCNLLLPSVIFFSLYFLFESSFLFDINNNYIASKKNLYNSGLCTDNRVHIIFTYNYETISYINFHKIIARQINNNNLQNYVNDAKGSVLKLNDYQNSANNQKYSYDAYGNVFSNLTSLTPNTRYLSSSLKQEPNILTIPNYFQYNGERFDNNSKLQYLRARFYNPEIKRFINQDDYNLLNKFGYVNANPIMKFDSSGHTEKNISFLRKIFEHTFDLERNDTAIKNNIRILLDAKNINWVSEKVITFENAISILSIAQDSMRIYKHEISCSHAAILFALSDIGICKPVKLETVINILSQNTEITPENYNLLGGLQHTNNFYSKSEHFTSPYDFFNKKSYVNYALIFTQNHVSFWMRDPQKPNDFLFSNICNSSAGMVRYSSLKKSSYRKINRSVRHYIILSQQL